MLCAGKIYFELIEKREKDGRKDIAIVRLEQLYPLPMNQLEALQQRYTGATWFWVQEEPQNMGAASYLKMQWRGVNFGIISRQPSASTATGYNKIHVKEQAELLETAFTV